MGVNFEDAEKFVDRFEDAPPERLDELYKELSAMTNVPEAQLREYIVQADDRDYLIERIQLFEGGDLRRDRDALIELLKRMIEARGSHAQVSEWARVIAANVPAPDSYIIDLIYNAPEVPRPEDVLEKALAYRPNVIEL